VSRRLTKAKPAEFPVPRPTFQPCWTEAKAVELANDQLALDTAANAGYRLAMVTLARSAEDLMTAALLEASGEGEESPAECVSRILAEAEDALKSRIEILKTAQARVLLTAAFVHGVKLPKG
jgi:hypothetical protein